MARHQSDTRREIDTPLGRRAIYRLDLLEEECGLYGLPYSIRILIEMALRNAGTASEGWSRALAIAGAAAGSHPGAEISIHPARVLLQDFTGVPVLADLAAMRSAMARLAGDRAALRVNPSIPVDLVVDHSLQVDASGTPAALAINTDMEYLRNQERYRFLKWGQSAFTDFRVVPPGTGIVHQVNLERLARVVWDRGGVLFPDTVLGADSHTTMVNGLGVLGWGVGGIEAEAAMMGHPISMLLPEVLGVRLSGSLPQTATATDLVLKVTETLRRRGVVGKFVEFFGPGLDGMAVADRATVANMCPEYGATAGYFPVDAQTIDYLRLTGRDEALVETVERYCRLQGLWRDDAAPIRYPEVVDMDLGTVGPSLAGPRRPQDRIDLDLAQAAWRRDLAETFGADPSTVAEGVEYGGTGFDLGHGAVVIAAITSCTNTSNPGAMVGAGLLARAARGRGLTSRPWVKTSFAPGSGVVTRYLTEAGLMEDLEALGFHVVGYGCTTCIGNSGPLPGPVSAAIRDHDLVAVAVLSGNRNFEGRISPEVRANYLASPALVVAYAIAGTMDFDPFREPLGHDPSGAPVYLRDLWPSPEEVAAVVAASLSAAQFRDQYSEAFAGTAAWQHLEAPTGTLYPWASASSYVVEPPFFGDTAPEPRPLGPIHGARVLLSLGDSVTTDHISPAGSIAQDSPAGSYLISLGIQPADFNSYGSRRGNDRVMTRGTFSGKRIRNLLIPGTEGGLTTDFTDGRVKTVYEAAAAYREAGIPLVVLAGSDYGMGSSRDWAAKGALLLGVRAVLARSFERIHRSNLVMMGVLPLTLPDDAGRLGLDGTESYDIFLDDSLRPRCPVKVVATRSDGSTLEFETVAGVDTPAEVEYLRHGGILPMILRRLATG
jgi:aconitate hydratase